MPRRSQAERSRSTRVALLETARRLFVERGYADVPAEEIVSQAGVTRGALYHHFADKRDLFRAVFEELETGIAAELAVVAEAGGEAVAGPDGPAALRPLIGSLLDICQRPEVVRIAFTDAPTVLGWQEWREIESRHALRLITHFLGAAARQGAVPADAVPTLARLVLSALIEAVLIVAHADDPAAARADAERALLPLLSGLVTPPAARS